MEKFEFQKRYFDLINMLSIQDKLDVYDGIMNYMFNNKKIKYNSKFAKAVAEIIILNIKLENGEELDEQWI